MVTTMSATENPSLFTSSGRMMKSMTSSGILESGKISLTLLKDLLHYFLYLAKVREQDLRLRSEECTTCRRGRIINQSTATPSIAILGVGSRVKIKIAINERRRNLGGKRRKRNLEKRN